MTERRVVVVGYDAAELLDIACVTSSLEIANKHGISPAYDVRLASPGGRPVECETGLTLQPQETLERVVGPLDTLVVSGGVGHWAAAEDRAIVGHVRRLARESRRVASVCTGASILAATGLLDGRRATTHWGWAASIAERYPAVTFDADQIFVRDGKLCTAAGVTSALDLTLAFVEEDHGTEVARSVARHLVTYLQRPGNQAQMSMFVSAPPPSHALVRRTVDHVARHLDGGLTTAALAARADVSERHLTRLFRAHLGQTPGRYVRQVRTEAAAQLLVSTSLPMTAVAARCGFGTVETLRQAFVARYGIPPSRYRTAQSSASGPLDTGSQAGVRWANV